MSSLLEAKAALRAQVLARRDAMTGAARMGASCVIAARARVALDVAPGTIVSAFLPIRSEVDLRPLMAVLDTAGAQLCVPAIVGDALQFRQFLPGVPLEPQGFGTFAPGRQAAVFDPELMLVPFAAFDRRGGRIGYGRGYYDRAIAALRAKDRTPRLVGIGFAVQEVHDAPMEPHDVPLDMILTESETIRPGPDRASPISGAFPARE